MKKKTFLYWGIAIAAICITKYILRKTLLQQAEDNFDDLAD